MKGLSQGSCVVCSPLSYVASKFEAILSAHKSDRLQYGVYQSDHVILGVLAQPLSRCPPSFKELGVGIEGGEPQ